MPEASPAQGWVGSLEGTWPESPSVGSGEARAFAPGPAGCAPEDALAAQGDHCPPPGPFTPLEAEGPGAPAPDADGPVFAALYVRLPRPLPGWAHLPGARPPASGLAGRPREGPGHGLVAGVCPQGF